MTNTEKLQHLTTYLGYQVKLFDNYEDKQGTLVGLQLKSLEPVLIQYDNSIVIHSRKLEEVSLILRPLSDLTKEIIINGRLEVFYKHLYVLFGGGFSTYENFLSNTSYIYSINPLKMVSYETMRLYLINHFDIDDIITGGFAIDVNKL